MHSGSEPEPSGERYSPPPVMRTAVGESDADNSRTILLSLSVFREEAAFQDAFSNCGYRVHIVESVGELYSFALDRALILLTDRVAILSVGNPIQCAALVIYLADDVTDAILREGLADHLLIRPINFADPLAFMRKKVAQKR